MPASASPSQAERIGDYVLMRRIGSGGMGEVWLGRHVISGGLGAIKRLAPGARLRNPLAVYFEREGRALARLAHPHVVPVYEVGDDYLISAYVDGGNLARRLHTPIEPDDALRVARQIANALIHAHERGVVHRDVKPSNILIDTVGNAYLADFGLAAFVGEDDDPARTAGTPQFMAPEQRRGPTVGPGADQYALGRTLLEMLVGSGVPLDPAAALAELPAYLPRAVHDAIARATAADPAARFPSMADFAQALTAIEIGDVGPPQRLAAVVRDPAPFAWLAGADGVSSPGAELQRADYRLRALAEQGLLRQEWVDDFCRVTGLADLGFSAWAVSTRLGEITAPEALARASDVVLLLHGWGGTRALWDAVAAAVCRDNARAVVLVPDLHGFGASPFAGVPTLEQAGALGLARCVDEWRRLLGLAALPTAMVGHSMAGLALLAIDDDDAGAHVSRIALNPILIGHDPAVRRRFRSIAWAVNTIGRFGPLRRLAMRSFAKIDADIGGMAPEIVARIVDQLVRMPGPVMGRIVHALSLTTQQLGRHRRAAVFASLDDPWLDPAALDRVIAQVGIEPAQVHRVATGGHHPHIESRHHPEWSARNLADLVRVIDTMLVTASQPSLGAISPSLVGSTMAANSTESF